MKPIAIGVVLAIVILALGFLVPAILPPTVSPTTVNALKEAELARRQLHAYDASLPLVGARADVEQLKEADFDLLVERSREEFDALNSEFNKRVSQAKSTDRENNVPESGLRAASMGPAGVRSSVSSFEKCLRDNHKMLTDAARNSRSANQADRNALGVGQVAGMVKLAEAGELLAEARELRARLTTEQGRLLVVAVDWAEARDEIDHYAGLDVTEIRGDLDADLDEIKAALEETRAGVDELRGRVAEREQTLADVRAQLTETRTQRLSLEEMGFIVGDDTSFEAYRAEYLRLSEALRQLQEQEQLLAFGGIEGGSLTDDDPLEGRIEGGETVLGLNELRRLLAVEEDKLARYTRGVKALEDQMNLVVNVGNEAQTQKGQYAERLGTLTVEIDQIRAGMDELAQQAFEKEDAALRAAREGVTSFKSAKSAADRWIADANSLQREKDPQRLNERLKLITRDSFAADAAANAEARAKTLLGRIQTERALGLGEYLDTLARVNELMPDSEFDATALRESFTQARDEAVSILNEAREGYERLAQKQSNTSWVHQASLAIVYHLLWQIDEFNADQHRGNLLDQLGRTIENRRQSPHLQQQVTLYALLTGGVEAPQPDLQSDEEPDEEQPEEEEPDDESD